MSSDALIAHAGHGGIRGVVTQVGGPRSVVCLVCNRAGCGGIRGVDADARHEAEKLPRRDVGVRLLACARSLKAAPASTAFAGYHAYYASRRASPALMLVVEALRPPENP